MCGIGRDPLDFHDHTSSTSIADLTSGEVLPALTSKSLRTCPAPTENDGSPATQVKAKASRSISSTRDCVSAVSQLSGRSHDMSHENLHKIRYGWVWFFSPLNPWFSELCTHYKKFCITVGVWVVMTFSCTFSTLNLIQSILCVFGVPGSGKEPGIGLSTEN